MKTQKIRVKIKSGGMEFKTKFPADTLGMDLDNHTLKDHLERITLNGIEITAYFVETTDSLIGSTCTNVDSEDICMLPIHPREIQALPDQKTWMFVTKNMFVRIGNPNMARLLQSKNIRSNSITTEISVSVQMNPKTGDIKGFFFSGNDQVFISSLVFEISYDEHRVLK